MRRDGMLLAGTSATILFLLGAGPSVYWLDSAELTASTFGLGICHPTGFSLLHVLGKAATLLPVGSIAFRMNLFAALCSGATISIVYGLAHRTMGDADTWTQHLPAATAALTLTGAHTFWLHAGITEIYSLNILWIAGALWFLWDLADDVNPRSYFSLCLWVGLGAGTHATFAPVVLGAFLCVIIARYKELTRVFLPFAPRAAAFLLLGGAVLLYLALAGARQPLHKWGPTETLRGFVDQLTARSIRGAFQQEIGGWNAVTIWVHGKTHLIQLWEQAGGGMLLAVLGVVQLIRRKRWVYLTVPVWIVLFDAIFSVKINPMGIHERQTGTPSLLAIALLAAAGSQWLIVALSDRLPSASENGYRYARVVSGVISLGAALFCMPLAASETWQSQRYAPYDYSALTAEITESDAVIVTVSDSMTAGWLYLQGIENRRPDMLVIIRQFLGVPAYHQLLSRRYGDTGLPQVWARRSRLPLIYRVVRWAMTQQRIVRWEPGDRADRLVDRVAEGGFPIFRLREKPGKTTLAQLESAVKLYLARQEASLSEQSRIILGGYFRYVAPYFIGQRAYTSAIAAVQSALRWNSKDFRALINQGVLAAMAREYGRAEQLAARAAALAPLSIRAWLNLATYRRVQNKLKLADDALDAATRLGQRHYRLHYERAMIAYKRGDLATARRHAAQSLVLNPTHPGVKALIKQLNSKKEGPP